MHGIADVLAFDAITLLAGHTSQVLAPTCVLNVSEPQAVQALTVKVLENAMKLDIPLRVNAALGKNWMEI